MKYVGGRLVLVGWLAGLLCVLPALARAQTIDLTGQWSARVHEDAVYRGAGGLLGDYTGLPINAASRHGRELGR
jgi:hypothetical protein